jgi:glycine cleavage system aminomethyltransferase T
MATYRGHVSKKLSGLMIEGESLPHAGARVLKDDKPIGHITSVLRSPDSGSVIALAYLKYGFFESGNRVQVEISNGALSEATVRPLPFYRYQPDASH